VADVVVGAGGGVGPQSRTGSPACVPGPASGISRRWTVSRCQAPFFASTATTSRSLASKCGSSDSLKVRMQADEKPVAPRGHRVVGGTDRGAHDHQDPAFHPPQQHARPLHLAMGHGLRPRPLLQDRSVPAPQGQTAGSGHNAYRPGVVEVQDSRHVNPNYFHNSALASFGQRYQPLVHHPTLRYLEPIPAVPTLLHTDGGTGSHR
jgi:hypothetical protein